MNNLENLDLDNLTLESLDEIPSSRADEIIENLKSNTQWKDPAKNMMMNGAKMNCRKEKKE